MAPPRNNDRRSGQPNTNTGTIPKSKVRNNCNVPQEAVTPTRRDMTSNLVTTSLDWVPVSEYNTRSNYNQSRKPANNTLDHELTDLDNPASFDSGFGRFVPVRPQPRVLPLNVQNRDNIVADHNDDGAGSTASGYSQHGYGNAVPNGLTPHSNHAAAAVMIVNPTTPNAVTGNMSQPFNAPGNQNRNNLTRIYLNSARNNLDGGNTGRNTTPPIPNSSRAGTKTVNLMSNMYDSGQGSSSNINENHQVHRESARALGEAMVASCPDAAAVERRLGQIREYIRVTSSLVDTMRNSEDEAYIEHTKEEYDELVEMVMKLKESEKKLVDMSEKEPENIEVPEEEPEAETETAAPTEPQTPDLVAITPLPSPGVNINEDVTLAKTSNTDAQALKKVTNIENEQLNKTLHLIFDDTHEPRDNESAEVSKEGLEKIAENNEESDFVEIQEIESCPMETEPDQHMNEVLRQNIMSCVEKVAFIQKQKSKSFDDDDNQDVVVVRPTSAQSNGSAYSENELWQNEIKDKMELSQQRLAALKQQQKSLMKYQAEAKKQLDEMNRARQSQEILPSTSHDNIASIQNQLLLNGHAHHHHQQQQQQQSRMYAANQIGVATTLPHASDTPQQSAARGSLAHVDRDPHDDRFSHRNIASSEEAGGGGGRETDGDDDESMLNERGRELRLKLRELHMKKQHMENLVKEFQKLQMVTQQGTSHNNNYSSSGEESLDEEPTRKCIKPGGNMKNEDPFKLMEIKAIKTDLQKTKELMRSVENYEAEHLQHAASYDEGFPLTPHSNIHDNKSEASGSGGWSREGSVCRVRNTLPHKLTNAQHCTRQHQSHEANIASLQELAQELRMETEKIMGERARLKDMVSNKETARKQKNASVSSLAPRAPPPGPAERRQMELRAMLQDKQRELEALLNKEKVLVGPESQAQNEDSRAASVVNHSYNSEHEEPASRSEQNLMLDAQNSRETENTFRGDSGLGGRSTINTLPSHMGSTYASDSDSASRTKLNQRNRGRRRQAQERQPEEHNPSPSNLPGHRHEPMPDSPSLNPVPPMSQNGDNPASMPYPHLPPPCWSNNKSNQDMRANQFTQNSHSQTMDRLLGTPQMSYPPTMPFNMMMPYGMPGMVGPGGCGCGCGVWGAWCWQQLAMQQREIQQLRDQLNHLEERWRVETASHILNNQVPPGNRANNYWDNFRSYSRQNLLSAHSKTNADAHLAAQAHAHQQAQAHPLIRAHNLIHDAHEPKRNVNPNVAGQSETDRHRSNVWEREIAPVATPDVLNLPPAAARARDRAALRNLNIPEILQAHANNLDSPANNSKKKSSSKLPAKNSSRRVNQPVPETSTAPEQPMQESVYTEVSALLGAHEANPDFLIELFREVKHASSEPLRRRLLQSVRALLAPANTTDPVTATSDERYHDQPQMEEDDDVVRFLIARSEEVFTPELLDSLAGVIGGEAGVVRGALAGYAGLRVRDVTAELLATAPMLRQQTAEEIDASADEVILQDVAGALISDLLCEQWPAGPVDLIDCSETNSGDLAEADQPPPAPAQPESLPDVVDTDEATPTEAEAEWLGLDRVPTRLHIGDTSGNQKD